MAEKIRIKDIAERAGVSVGTVDRVLHDRPNVSKPARDKVEKALKEMNYQPNVYASALAYNKSYTFYLLIPKHESEAYWEEIEEGAKKCEDTRRDFHIDVEIRFYERSKNRYRIVFCILNKILDYVCRKRFYTFDENVLHLLQINNKVLNLVRRQTMN